MRQALMGIKMEELALKRTQSFGLECSGLIDRQPRVAISIAAPAAPQTQWELILFPLGPE
ncbi:hypothetical protein ACEP6V_21595 [Pseudomonas aeruginosa]|uniref:hypothetical protein n=1 Tax=Pseudomonas aeruginosa TaxID=287 RepID=UPI001ADC06BA|nr:hypothetical protein [Pseudomonas aeruginosa]MBO8337042.1 hypothetical protein [Pseudomonas aeruginosa]HCF4080913.1 hypothetical protein [Pseudomonas aeruginosa]